MKKRYTFSGEFYQEILDLNGKKYEHIGFKSDNGGFEKLLESLPKTTKLPLKSQVTIDLL